jgi:hypothetical protein
LSCIQQLIKISFIGTGLKLCGRGEAAKEKKIRVVLSKRRENLDLDLDILSSLFTITMFGILFVGSIGFHFW